MLSALSSIVHTMLLRSNLFFMDFKECSPIFCALLDMDVLSLMYLVFSTS